VGYNKVNPIGANGFTDDLRARSRLRRQTLKRLAEPGAAPRPPRNDILPKLEFGLRSLSDLSLPKRNVRALTQAHIREVAASIGAFGFNVPVLTDPNGEVIDGAVRVEAARLMGLSQVPCIVAAHLTKAEVRTLRLCLNRSQERGEWNFDDLKLEIQELIVDDEVPIELSGFTVSEVDQILMGDEAEAPQRGPLEPDVGAVAIARIGDMFQLGPHRLICGDATDPAVLGQLVEPGALARLVLTDEPFNVKISGHVTGGAHREFAMASGEMTEEEFLRFNVSWIEAALAHLCDGGVFGTFIDWRGAPVVSAAAAKLGLTPLNLIVWAKTNAGMGSLYRSQHELLPLYKKGDAPHVNNVELGKSGRWRSNVWTYPGASSLGSDARRGLKDHPTVKPVVMLADALLDLTGRGDIVLDPFLGSGSTLIAAHRTGRVCRGVELDPLYVDVIIRRYQGETGDTGILAATGEALEALAMRRKEEAAPGYPSQAPS
jgi:DNA modification methylase